MIAQLTYIKMFQEIACSRIKKNRLQIDEKYVLSKFGDFHQQKSWHHDHFPISTQLQAHRNPHSVRRNLCIFITLATISDEAENDCLLSKTQDSYYALRIDYPADNRAWSKLLQIHSRNTIPSRGLKINPFLFLWCQSYSIICSFRTG